MPAMTLILSLLLLHTPFILALQVSPNSPCAPVCLDDPNDDASDSNALNTTGADITCIDKDYNTTAKGQRFVSCLNCLQTSTASDSGQNDQDWYLCMYKSSPFEDILTYFDCRQSTLQPCNLSLRLHQCFRRESKRLLYKRIMWTTTRGS